MQDKRKTKDQLTQELEVTRQRILELESSEDQLKRMEESLRRNENDYKLLFENVIEGVFVIDAATMGIVFGNRSLATIYGFDSVEDTIGINPLEFIPSNDRDRVAFIIMQDLFGNDKRQINEFLTNTNDGRQVWISAVGAKTEYQGKPAGLISVRDITQQKKAEEARRESEKRYDAIFNNKMHMVYVHDELGRFLEINDYGLELTGYSRDDLEKVSFQSIVHPEDFPKAIEAVAEVMATGCMDQPVELRIATKPGGMIWVETFCMPLELSDGHYRGLAIAQDITDRKRMEEALRKSEQSYRLLAENASDVIWTMDMNLRYTYVSPSVTRLRGYSVEEIMNQTLDKSLTSASKELAISAFAEEIAMELAESKDLLRSRTLELEMKCNDGSTIWTEITMGFLRDSNNNPLGITGVTRDVTWRRKAEEELRETERRYRAIFDNPLQLVYINDLQGRFIEANACASQAMGYSPEDIANLSYYNLVHPEDLPKAFEALAKNMMDGTLERPVEVRLITKSGEIVWIETVGAPLYQNGELYGGLGIGRDITERKAWEKELRERTEALERSNKELEQFAYVASHDLQEPLRMVASYVQLLSRRYKGKLDADADDFIGYAVDGTNRMQKMINDLLAFSRVGTRGKDFVPTDCESVLNTALANLQVAVKESESVITHDTLPTIEADSSQLVQVFQNLIGNAIKFCGDNTPHIHISTKRDDGKWLFSVSDDGIGLDPEYRDRIFIIFQRLHGKHEYHGTGIGLAICKKIVERHGGTIWVESEVGNGATFCFTIPTLGGQQDEN